MQALFLRITLANALETKEVLVESVYEGSVVQRSVRVGELSLHYTSNGGLGSFLIKSGGQRLEDGPLQFNP